MAAMGTARIKPSCFSLQIQSEGTVLFVEYVWNTDFSSRVENSHDGRDALILMVAIKNASRNARTFP